MARCTRCESANVDYEGYCWSCEFQHPVAVAAVPEPPSPSPVAEEPLPDLPARSTRFKMLIGAGTVAGIVVVVGFGGVVVAALRSNSHLMAAQVEAAPLAGRESAGMSPGAVSAKPVADPAAACVRGLWRVTAVAQDLQVGNLPVVHLAGTGGTVLLQADGTARWDAAGMSVTGTVAGRSAVATAAGTVTFRYTVSGSALRYEGVQSQATYTVRVDGAQVDSDELTLVDSDSNRFSCGQDSMTIASGPVTLHLTRTG